MELKACPFYGYEPSKKYYPDCVQIVCKCGYVSKHSTMPDNLFEKWNTRPIEDTLTVENAHLRELLKRTVDAGKGLRRAYNVECLTTDIWDDVMSEIEKVNNGS